MAAAAEAMTNRHIVATILHHLSDMKYKDRRQYGPDQPVEFLEFRPTLVPSILVNKLWADEGISILWRRYPHLPALKGMSFERRQYYANAVERVFALSPPPGHESDLDYLDKLEWPKLTSLELEIDYKRHGKKFYRMLRPGLKHLELSGPQSGDSKYLADYALTELLGPCRYLRSIRIGPETIDEDDPLHASDLFNPLYSLHSLETIEIKGTNLMDKDALFTRLGKRRGLRSLEIDLEPGLALLPVLAGPNALQSLFTSLKRLNVMCYPEIALALPAHLSALEDLQLDLARVPNQPMQDSDLVILEDICTQLAHCPHLRLLKIGIALLATDFPSFSTFPRLSGIALVKLAETCPNLEDINLFATEPAAIDGSNISSEHFDQFCKLSPHLRNLSLKLHPTTTSALETTALQSLGAYCPELEILRLKVSVQLPTLPVANTVPHILINEESTPNPPSPEEYFTNGTDPAIPPSAHTPTTHLSFEDLTPNSQPTTPSPIPPLFPRLIHLAIARPESVLSVSSDSFTISSTTSTSRSSSIIDPDLEESLVRSWAHPLLTHFPRLEILEAWGDWVGQDNESLNYFLPTEEILASTWEFLSGVEQDLWEDGEDSGWEEGAVPVSFEEGESWDSYGSGSIEDAGDDWDKASLMNEFIEPSEEATLGVYEDEPEGMITPGATTEKGKFFEASLKQAGKSPQSTTAPIEEPTADDKTPSMPVDEIRNTHIS